VLAVLIRYMEALGGVPRRPGSSRVKVGEGMGGSVLRFYLPHPIMAV
jgi:hypothetical protein